MKRRDLLRHLRHRGCLFVREGGEHSIGKIRLSTEGPRCHVTEKFQITRLKGFANSYISRHHKALLTFRLRAFSMHRISR